MAPCRVRAVFATPFDDNSIPSDRPRHRCLRRHGPASLSSLGGGIALYEIANADLGLASAGYAARAQDASTLFTNPAGMSLLTEAEFTGGLQLLYGSVEFTKDPGLTAPLLRGDGDGGNAIGALRGQRLLRPTPR